MTRRTATACGDCFNFATANARGSDLVVHGNIKPLNGPHAWIERGDRVFDWQTHVLHWYYSEGLGKESYREEGWPIREFYSTFRPRNTKKYTAADAATNRRRSGNRGPWHGVPKQYEDDTLEPPSGGDDGMIRFAEPLGGRVTHRRRNEFYAKPESHRGGVSIGVAEYPGFHTSSDPDTALAYAYAKTPPEEETFPVVVGLDMQGYERLLDYDTVMSVLPVVRDMLSQAPSLDDWYEMMEFHSPDYNPPESAGGFAFQVTLGAIMESGAIDPEVFEDETEYQVFRDDILEIPPGALGKQGAEAYLSPLTREILMDAVQQYRYLDNIPEARIVSVTLIQPMWPDIIEFDDEQKGEDLEELGWNYVHWDDVGMFSVPRADLVRMEWARPRGARIEFHGTSLPNLLNAAPDLTSEILAKLPEMPGIPEWYE